MTAVGTLFVFKDTVTATFHGTTALALRMEVILVFDSFFRNLCSSAPFGIEKCASHPIQWLLYC